MVRIATVICALDEEPDLLQAAQWAAARLGPVLTLTDRIGEGRYPTQAALRQEGLEWAKRQGAQWLLQLAADEVIVGGANVRACLDGWREPFFPCPYIEEDGRRRLMGHKLVNLQRVESIVAWGSYFRLDDGTVWEAGAIEEEPYLSRLMGLPFRLEHRPWLRTGTRAGYRLGAVEHLEPVPANARIWAMPLLNSRATNRGGEMDTHYCPACGTRYPEAGVCTEGHASEPVETQPLPPTPDTPVDPANGTEPVPQEPQATDAPVATEPSQVPELMAQLATLQGENANLAKRAHKAEEDIVAVAAERDSLRLEIDRLNGLLNAQTEAAQPVEGTTSTEGGAAGEGSTPAEPTPAPASPEPQPETWPTEGGSTQ